MIFRILSLVAALALAACGDSLPGKGGPDIAQTLAEAPPGTCWGKLVTPAVIETVTDHALVQPAGGSAGGAATPGVYRTETHQVIVQERKVTWFETPCPSDLTPDFVASLQRALAARDFYRGPVSGELDTRTRAAIRKFQRPDGLDSGILSIAAARKLGLVAVELPEE